MRKIEYSKVVSHVKDALININYHLEDSFVDKLKKARESERKDISRSILDDIIENQDIAKKGITPLCQDTGMVVAFVEAGRDVLIDFSIEKAINEGVKQAYSDGYLRKSVVNHPFKRQNTQDNTPAIVHYKQIDGDSFTINLAAKGAGSENMSRMFMLKPSEGIEGVKAVVKKTVLDAGGRPCPPIIVGIGIGGNFEKCTLLAKEALLRDLDDHHSDDMIAELESTLLKDINALGVGPMGVGGDTTCLGVKIKTHPMHIASLPVAVNLQCHANRHEKVIL